jgi:hypothetical protein
VLLCAAARWQRCSTGSSPRGQSCTQTKMTCELGRWHPWDMLFSCISCCAVSCSGVSYRLFCHCSQLRCRPPWCFATTAEPAAVVALLTCCVFVEADIRSGRMCLRLWPCTAALVLACSFPDLQEDWETDPVTYHWHYNTRVGGVHVPLLMNFISRMCVVGSTGCWCG